MNENETLREQMWDLCYGLLTADEVAALHKQIKSDPAAARLYAEVRLQADLVASAAKVEDASVTLSVPDEGRKVQPAGKSHSGPGESPFKLAKSGRSRKKLPLPSYRTANWLAGLAAMVLVGLIGYGFLSPARLGSSPTDDMVVATVYGPDSLQSGLTQNLKVVAKNRRGEPTSAPVSYFVYSADRKLALDGVVQTDEAGEAQLSLSGSLIRPGAVLEVHPQSENDSRAWSEKSTEHGLSRSDLVTDSPKVVVPLDAKEEPVTSDVQFERRSYQPDETIRFWVHSWRAFSNEPAVPADDWKLVADNGRELQPSVVDARPEAGIVSGEFQLPADAPAGHYRFVGVNRQSGQSVNFDQVAVGVDADELGVYARRTGMAGTASDDRHRLMLRGVDALAKAESDKAPEPHDLKSKMARAKNELAASSAPAASAPKTASPPLPAPAKTPGGVSGTAPAPPAAAIVAAASTRGEDETKQIAPSAKADRAEQKAAVAEASGDSLVVTVPAELADRKLLAVITKFNVPVATQQYQGLERSEEKLKQFKYAESYSAKNSPAPAPSDEPAPAAAEGKNRAAERQLADGELQLHLPPEADGELLVTLYDQSVQPSAALYRQVVRRPSSREMKLEVTQESAANFTITATDHNGQAIPRYFLAARMVKANAVEFEKVADAPAGRYASGGKAAADGSRSGAFGPAGAGFGGGGGKPAEKAAEKLPDLKEDKKEADKKKDVLDKQDQDKELKLQMARSAATPGELAAKPAPPSATGGEGAEGIETLSKRASSNGVNQLFMEDMTARDYLSEPFAEQTAMPQEVLLASNDSLIQDAERAEEAATQSARADFQKMVGRLVLVVAAAALLLFGLLAIVHRPAQAKVWVPAMAVVAGSFAVGSFWLMNGNIAGPTAGNVALAPDRPAPTEYLKADVKPMAPTTRSLPLPAMDDLRTNEELKEETGSGEIRPSVPAPGGGPMDRATKLPDSFRAPPRGGSLAGAKPGAAMPPKSESAEKPAEPAPAGPEVRTEDGQKKLADERKKEEPSRESAKDAAQPKKSGAAQALEKSAAMKSMSESARDKRAKTPSLLWQPNLQANEKGKAELNIQLPTEEGDYYLVVDVQSPNGVGTIQRRIPVHVPAATPASPAAPASPAKP